MATYNSRAELEDENNRKKAKELTAKLEAQERANKAQAEIDKKRNAQELKGDDVLPTDPIDDFVIPGCMDPAANNYNPQANIDDGSCDYGIIVIGLSVPGCTDSTALNYNPLANFDDGSCTYPVSGCTNPLATNYNPLATVDDGSCIIAGCMDPLADNYDPTATVSSNSCRWLGCKDVNAANYVGLPPPDGLSLIPITGQTYSWQSTITGDGGDVFSIPCRYDKVRGCTDINAINYNSLAVVDDGSCLYSGCTDPLADNYDATLAADCLDNIINTQFYSQYPGWNSCCDYTIKGCTDPLASNYDPSATVDDGSCIYEGCTNPDADNYDPNATIDDGSCEWYGCTDPLADNYSFPGSSVDGPNGVFTYLNGNAVDDGSCLYDDPRDPCYQIGDITDPANGGGGGMVFALPNTTSNPTPFYFEVSLVDLSTGGNPLEHHYDVISNPVATLDDVNITCGKPSFDVPSHNFNSPWFESIDISIPNNQFRYGYGTGSFQPTVTPPPINQPTGVNIGDPVQAFNQSGQPLFTSTTTATIIDIELIPAGTNITSTGQLVSTLLFDSYLFTFSQSMVAPPLSQPIKILTTGGNIPGSPFTTSGAEWGAYDEPLTNLLTFFDQGQSNTSQIISYPPAGAEPVWPTHTTAAKLCDDYITTPNANDWFLPSLDEFDLMYQKLGPGTPHAAALNLTIGINTSEMMDDVYWTSSDLMDGGPVGAGFYYAWAYSTNPGPWSSSISAPIPVGPVAVTRCSTLSVRAIRKFRCSGPIEPPPPEAIPFNWVDGASRPDSLDQQDGLNGSISLYTPGLCGSGISHVDVSGAHPLTGNFFSGTFSFEGVIGGRTFQWTPMSTDAGGNMWDLSDFDDANNPDGYTITMYDADHTYLGTWHYSECFHGTYRGVTTPRRQRNWLKNIAEDQNLAWYQSVPRPDFPTTETTSLNHPDKISIVFRNVTHIDGPNPVVCYGYNSTMTDPLQNPFGTSSFNLKGQWMGPGTLVSPNNLNVTYTAITGVGSNWLPAIELEPFWTFNIPNSLHTEYSNEYHNEYLGETSSYVFIHLDCATARTKRNTLPSLSSTTPVTENIVHQQKNVVCAKRVMEEFKEAQDNSSFPNRLLPTTGGYLGDAHVVNTLNPYHSQVIPGNGGSQNISWANTPNATGSRYNPKHYLWPWFANYQPDFNADGLTWYPNLQAGINELQTGIQDLFDPQILNEKKCFPEVDFLDTGTNLHTWNFCSFEDANGNVFSAFATPWFSSTTLPQGPVVMDYLGAASNGDDFYNDVVITLNTALTPGNVINVDFTSLGVTVQPFNAVRVNLRYMGLLPWTISYNITGIPAPPVFTFYNDCSSALAALNVPIANQNNRVSVLDIGNTSTFQLKTSESTQNINKKTPVKIITYINGIPLYSRIRDAVYWGRQYGLEGYHTHEYKSMIGYMAGESHEQSIKATEGQVIPEAVLESYQLPEEQITPPMQQPPTITYTPPAQTPTPPVQTPTPPSTPMPPPDYSSGSSGGSSGGGY